MARARAAPLHRGLPEEIVIWEILLRLPPKAVLRSRAVCRTWRRATSSRDFLLAHHGRQPSLPLLYDRSSTGESLDIMPLEHRAGVAAADQLQPVARLGCNTFTSVEASCDGLVIICTTEGDSCFSDVAYFSVCNPATRQHARLPLLHGFSIAGMYPHPPTGEYRLLLYPDAMLSYDDPPDTEYPCYVYALGSCDPPRHIGWAEVEESIHALRPVLFRGSLHWHIEQDEGKSSMIMVFDTTAESFWQMCAPAVPGPANLFEMDGVLGMASFNNAPTTIDIWTTKDYENQAWAFMYRVELPVAELTVRFGFDKYSNLIVSSWGDDVLIMVQSGEWLLQIGVNGRLVASFPRKSLGTTEFRLKQSLVPHTFFPTLEDYVVNTWPFISPADYLVNT